MTMLQLQRHICCNLLTTVLNINVAILEPVFKCICGERNYCGKTCVAKNEPDLIPPFIPHEEIDVATIELKHAPKYSTFNKPMLQPVNQMDYSGMSKNMGQKMGQEIVCFGIKGRIRIGVYLSKSAKKAFRKTILPLIG